MLIWGCRFRLGVAGAHQGVLDVLGVCRGPRIQWDREGLIRAAGFGDGRKAALGHVVGFQVGGPEAPDRGGATG